AFDMGIRAGVDPQVLYKVFSAGTGQNTISDKWCPVPGIVPEAPSSKGYKGGFKIQLMLKDYSLATSMAESLGSKPVLGKAGLEAWKDASGDSRFYDLDSRVMYQYVKARGDAEHRCPNMPAPGDQWKDNKFTNPYEEQKQHVNEYTAQEIATLQSRLDKQLGPEYISTRPGNGGGKVHYLAAEKVINLANEVFGFNGWSSAIRDVQIDFCDESPTTGKINLGLSTIVRVSLKDGTFHEDIGYGHIENCKGKAAAFEKAKKEAVTDALKRSLRNFGNVLGNCLYDKDYLQRVTKVRVAPSKWDADNLHRHPDYAPIKKEALAGPSTSTAVAAAPPARMPSAQSNTSEFEDEFGGNLFDEVDFSHPDEVHLDNSITEVSVETPVRPLANSVSAQAMNRQQPNRVASMPNARQFSAGPQNGQQNGQQPRPQPPSQTFKNTNNQPPTRMMPPPQQANGNNQNGFRSNPSSASESTTTNGRQSTPPESVVTPSQVPAHVPSGFVSGAAASALVQPPEAGAMPPIKLFDPHHESPSIRRTQGIDARKSAPIKRSEVGAPTVPIPNPKPMMNGAAPANRSNFVNPAMDASRRIGMPGGMQQSPLANRSAYKPPAMKRPLPAENAASRPPLADMSNVQQTDGASDPKKPKLDVVSEPQQASGETQAVV
ncbi:recombination protein Rad52, partial [Aureobasidium melanogenum]